MMTSSSLHITRIRTLGLFEAELGSVGGAKSGEGGGWWVDDDVIVLYLIKKTLRHYYKS